MNDSVLYSIASLAPRTMMYPLGNIAVIQQVKSLDFFKAVDYSKSKGVYSGYRFYAIGTLITQYTKWESYNNLVLKGFNTSIASLWSGMITSLITQPFEVLRQKSFLRGTKLDPFRGLRLRFIQSNLRVFIELNMYEFLKARNTDPFLIGPCIFSVVKTITHPIDTAMRMQISNRLCLHSMKFRHFYNGFIPATIKSVITGQLHYYIYENGRRR